jgi:lysozyme family protein
MTFDQAFEAVIGHEGGYVNNPKDPGGETRYGISKRAYPAEDIRNLTLARAKELYLRDYWLQAGCDKVPGGVAFDLFDTAVNSGVSRAVKMLQTAVGVTADGKLGPATLAAINAANAPALKGRFNGARLQFMTDLPEWVTFGKGWARRIASNLMRA